VTVARAARSVDLEVIRASRATIEVGRDSFGLSSGEAEFPGTRGAVNLGP